VVDTEAIGATVAPALELVGAELYDVTYGGGVLTVAVERPEGLDTATLAQLTRSISFLLDEADPMPGAYTLEVTSPGLERKLRLPRHFAGAVGGTVSVTAHRGEHNERIRGLLRDADDLGIVVEDDDGEHRIGYDDITRAKTVFEWGPTPKPGSKGKAVR
jgi:ribosome maturation factor RimP